MTAESFWQHRFTRGRKRAGKVAAKGFPLLCHNHRIYHTASDKEPMASLWPPKGIAGGSAGPPFIHVVGLLTHLFLQFYRKQGKGNLSLTQGSVGLTDPPPMHLYYHGH